MILKTFLLLLAMVSVASATDYQVTIYLNEIRAGYKPAYTSTITIMDVSGRVAKTIKNTFSTPVISLASTDRICRTVTVKEQNPPVFKGLVITCSPTSISTPDYLLLKDEPK